MSATEASIEEIALNSEDLPDADGESVELEEFSPAQLLLEDFVVTALLSAGRPLRAGELSARAEEFSPSRFGLKEALSRSTRVRQEGREWDCVWRLARKGLTREERSRQPIESMIKELLLAVGKPLPAAVIAREVSLMRNEFDPNMKTAVSNVLRSTRFALEVGTDVWLHQDFVLTLGAPTDETLIRANNLQNDPDFEGLVEFAEITAEDAAGIAQELMEFTGGPLSQKVIGYFVRRANPKAFSPQTVAAALNNREKFQPLISGFVALKEQLHDLRASVQDLLDEIGGSRGTEIDVNALLRARVAPTEVIAPKPEEIEEVRKLAKAGDGTPVSLASVVLDLFEFDPEDPKLVPTLQGLNNALRANDAFMPVGIGRFILRESIPSYINDVPEELRPVLLQIRNPETGDSFDFEMTDDGLEGDSADFVHSPEWEEVGEETEVRMPRRVTVPETVRAIILPHHLRAGTVKLRQLDQEFFDLTGPMARLAVREKETNRALTAWASRESGLIHGLGSWYKDKVPASGGVIVFEKDNYGQFIASIGEPDEVTFIDEERAAELETLRASAKVLSLYELLQRVMVVHKDGKDLAGIWAEVNYVRRTSKRVFTSVLCGYQGFFFKQRGPKQLLWRFDATRSDQSFKKNKKKYVRD